MAQTEIIAGLLRTARRDVRLDVRLFATSGDLEQATPVEQLEATAFTDTIDMALIDHEIDIAVHSYKDLPHKGPEGLIVGAVPVRGDVREALVSRDGSRLSQLRQGAVVGVSSERRASAVRALRPDLRLCPIRGPVDVRVAKVHAGLYDATILAVVGLDRLGMSDAISEIFEVSVIPPAPGQGALAVHCRGDDVGTIELLSEINDAELHAAVDAERAQGLGEGGG